MITTKDLTIGFRFKDGDTIFTIHSISSTTLVTLSYRTADNIIELMPWIKLDLAVVCINDYGMTILPRANNRLILNYTETL
jgi:hypothetical protein